MGENLPTPRTTPKIDNFQYFLMTKPWTKIYFMSRNAIKLAHSNSTLFSGVAFTDPTLRAGEGGREGKKEEKMKGGKG